MAGSHEDDDELDKLLDSTLDDLDDIDKKHALLFHQHDVIWCIAKLHVFEYVRHVKPTPVHTTPKPTTSKTASSSTSTSTTTTTSTNASTSDADKSEDELADKFAQDMADMLKVFQGGDMEKNLEELVKNMGGLKLPEGAGGSDSASGNEEADISTILSAFAALDAQGGSSSDSGASSSSSDSAMNISDKLKKIAENAKNIGEQEAGGEELEKMLQDFESNPEFQSVMEGMVNQMISKDVLYEPMKELREKYPKWLSDNHSKLSEEEYGKYIKQYDIVQKICCVYEAAGENASNEQMQEVVQLMQDMAEYGQPPQDIIKELAPGVQIGADGVPVFPGVEGGDAGGAGCTVM